VRTLVLEDDNSRLKWLRRIAPKLIVVAEYEVGPFLEHAHRERFELVIMDHDLGGGPDGRTAATFLDAHDAPIIVWSQNEPKAAEMGEILRQRGQNLIAIAPFGSPVLTTVIQTLTRRAGG
jgi:hypothetical protein